MTIGEHMISAQLTQGIGGRAKMRLMMYTDYIWMDLSELEVSSTNQGSRGVRATRWFCTMYGRNWDFRSTPMLS